MSWGEVRLISRLGVHLKHRLGVLSKELLPSSLLLTLVWQMSVVRETRRARHWASSTHFIFLLVFDNTTMGNVGDEHGMGRGHGVPIRTEDEACASRWSGSTCSPQGGVALDMFTPPSHLLHPPSVHESNAAPKTLALTRKLHVKRNNDFSLT